MAAADINARIDHHGRTRLFIAAENGDLAAVNYLLDLGADVNISSYTEKTPLYAALANRHYDVVARLVTVPGIDVNKRNRINSETPLYTASSEGLDRYVNLLLSVPGINVNQRAGVRLDTPLIAATTNGAWKVVQLLVNAPGIDISKRVRGKTALDIAREKRYGRIIQIIEEAGSALFNAARTNNLAELERLLSDPTTDVNQQLYNGLAPLHIATWNGFVGIVERLLAVPGINVNIKTMDGYTPLYIARNRGHDGIVRLLESKMQKWRGFSRSDISVLNTIFETESTSPDKRPDAENVSCCPICFKIVPFGRTAPQTVSRESGCMYMLGHNCSTLGGYYHLNLYEKYKNPDGTICWCTICGRICQQTPHRHYQLGPVNGPKADTIVPREDANPYGGEADCIKFGGGGLKEKLMRYRRMREYAHELQSKIDKILFEDAINQLIEETWNSLLLEHADIEKIASEKKWNISNIEFMEFKNASQTYAPAPNVLYPFAGKPSMVPILDGEGMNNISLADTPVLIQLVHRREDGSIRTHEQKISIDTLFEALSKQFGGAGSPHFGICMFDDGCNGIHYPDELQYILDHYPKTHLSDEKRALYQDMINVYRTRFNDAYLNPVFKARVDANIAAGAEMPVGGAGAARGGSRPKTRKRKHKS